MSVISFSDVSTNVILPEFSALSHVEACALLRCLGPGIMATYVDILKSEFPEIDSELFDYITGERPRSSRWFRSAGTAVRRPAGAAQTGLQPARRSHCRSSSASELTG